MLGLWDRLLVLFVGVFVKVCCFRGLFLKDVSEIETGNQRFVLLMSQGVFKYPFSETIFVLTGVVSVIWAELLFERKFHFLKLFIPSRFTGLF